MTYDHWKTTNKDDEQLGRRAGECDHCGQMGYLMQYSYRTWVREDCLIALDAEEDERMAFEDEDWKTRKEDE